VQGRPADTLQSHSSQSAVRVKMGEVGHQIAYQLAYQLNPIGQDTSMMCSTESNSNDDLRDKACHVVDYLRALSSARTVPVRDDSSYEQVLWIHEVPREKECFAQAWGRVENESPDDWLRVKKRREPARPAVPRECEEWVDQESLGNTVDIPSIRSTVIDEAPASAFSGEVSDNGESNASSAIEYRTRRLEDHPQVLDAWNRYLDEQWSPWQEQYDRWRNIQNAYSKLFQIYQAQQRNGEELELVFAIGLLQWRTSAAEPIRRHMLTSPAVLSFDAPRGEFTVGPSPDGAELSLELDMLDMDERFVHAERIVKQQLAVMGDDLWDRTALDPLIQALSELLADRAQYDSERLKPIEERAPDAPRISFSPALILRKRSARGLVRILDAIRGQIAGGAVLPGHFRELCEDYPQPDGDGLDGEADTGGPIDTNVYFPLLVNDEQKQIVHKLRSSTGVLVQGPPGTGKSHTIANLICHLLASGQRVLVTAQTQRALQVLQGLIPESIRPLCVSLLGAGLEEQRGLETSVSRILSRLDQWNAQVADAEITQLESRLDELRRSQAANGHLLRQRREADTRQHVVADGNYQGTAAHIARQLELEAPAFGWLEDDVAPQMVLPLRPDELFELLCDLRSANALEESELLDTNLVADSELPDIKEFESLVRCAADRRTKLGAVADLLNSPVGSVLVRSRYHNIMQLVEKLNVFSSVLDRLRRNAESWVGDAIQSVLAGKPRLWEELVRGTSNFLAGLDDDARSIARDALHEQGNVDHSTLLHDAQALKTLLDNGRQIHFWSLWGQPLRRYGYIIRGVKIGGQTCDHPKPLAELIKYLTVEQTLARAWNLWKGRSDCLDAEFPLQVAELERQCELLAEVLGLRQVLDDACEAVSNIPDMGEPSWADAQASRVLAETCRASLLKMQLGEAEKRIAVRTSKLQRVAENARAHPSTLALVRAVVESDFDAARATIENIRSLHAARSRAMRRQDRLLQLGTTAPRLRASLESDFANSIWDERLPQIERAWNWAIARSWLNKWNTSDDADNLERQITQTEEDARRATETVAATRAWRWFFSRMTDHHRRHLLGWQQAVNKLGKGTGRHAWKHRRAAQGHLNECRPAVPAWVMPLYRVFETVLPTPGAFDVVIIDEASQCGPDSLVLFYLAKRVIVVGDDQQISPEAVGLDRDIVDGLRAKHLLDFEHADAFSVDSSLFDHAKRRFGNRIVLREHFRCMPEIIRFSNDLCYAATPLTPLRQYPPDRLEPIMLRHVPTGHREGEASRVINRPEAEEVANAVTACCRDQRYDGRTMGVIALQGNSQARLIEQMLLKSLGAEEMTKRRLICGDPYSFQGDERHVIFLSMVAAPNERIGALTKAPDQRRFNVAASRARDQMWLFHSANRSDLSENCLRRRLLGYFENPSGAGTIGADLNVDELRRLARSAGRRRGSQPAPFDSWFEVDVALEISVCGFHVIPQFPIADKRVDLVVEGRRSRLGIECYGDEWHGADVYDQDMDRQRKIERAGLKIWTIREYVYYANRSTALEPLWSLLSDLRIYGAGEGQLAEHDRDSFANATHGTAVQARREVIDANHNTPAHGNGAVLQQAEIADSAPNGSGDSDHVDDYAPERRKEIANLDFQGRCDSGVRSDGPDLREAKTALVEIVKAHGPMPRISAYRLYILAKGLRRVTKLVRHELNRAVATAVREGLLEEIDEYGSRDIETRIVRIAGTPAVVVRPRGDRKLDDIPPSEIADVMRSLTCDSTNGKPEDRERLYRDVLAHYDLARLTDNARQILDLAYRICYSDEKT